jgi:hypothetical protein
MAFNPKDNHIRSIMERLEKDNATFTDYNSAKQLSRFSDIRDMRRRDEIYIGMDRRKKVSVIFVTKPIKRKGKGFVL